MKKILFFLLISNYIFAQWSISNAERSALISLYNTTNGEHWDINWDISKDPKTWYGIVITKGSVTEINLAANALSGNFPSVFGVFDHLEKLDLSSNQLQGSISSSVSGLSNLKRLDISNNNLSGDPSLTVSSLSALEELRVGNNQFAFADIDGFLQQYHQIKTLDLSSVGLTSVPQKISQYTQLENLILANNNITENFTVLSSLHLLKELDISGNQIAKLPSEIATLTNLKVLNLADNKVNANFNILSSLQKLEWLSLENNNLTIIPSQVLLLKNLVHLNISRNALADISGIAALASLEQLYLNNNQLLGNYPAEITQLKKLQMISLANNLLNGDLPDVLPAILYLDGNRYNEVDIKNLLNKKLKFADLQYTPQRYDQFTRIATVVGNSAELTQSISGEDYTYNWYKSLDKNLFYPLPKYTINAVEKEDFDYYTCEAYFLKKFPEYVMEVSFFREPILLEDALGVADITSGLSIYPNPASDYLHIKGENIKINNSEIYDMSGRKVMTTTQRDIRVQHLPSGTYLITIATDKGLKTFKWIKN